MKRMLIAAAVAVGMGFACFAQKSILPAPQSKDPNSWWQKRFAEKQALIKAGGSKVVFLGDSITHNWEGPGKAQWDKYFAGAPYHALNLGYGGDRTEHVLWRLDHGELSGYSPSVIVLMIGTNNTGHHKFEDEPPLDTILGIKAVLDKIREKAPQARTILLPIFPRGPKPDDPNRLRNEAVNKEIQRFANGTSVVWCDFNSQFLTTDGTLTKEMMGDSLHPGAAGYEIWAKNVIPVIDRCLTEKLLPVAATPEMPLNWLGRMQQKRQQVVDDKDHAFDVVFFGDSINHLWDNKNKEPLIKKYFGAYDILNLGDSGERTQHLIWRALNGGLSGYKAKCIMLMIGTNNGNDSAEDVALGIRKILDAIALMQPDAKTLLLPIFPRGPNAQDKHRMKNEKTNAIIKAYADGKKVIWCDFNAKFLGPDGTLSKDIMPDYLHPNLKGCEIWAQAVLPYFKEICGK